MSKYKFYVQGMHCPACEMIIEKELSSLGKAEVSLAKQTLALETEKEIGTEELNNIFKTNGYSFSKEPFSNKRKSLLKPLIYTLIVIIIFFFITKIGLASFININTLSPIGAFFVFGLIAGLSSCAALVGGLVLSLSKNWSQGKVIEPNLLFNVGRLLSFSILGFLLGSLGEKVKISSALTLTLTVIVSIIMFILALQMLNIKPFNQIRLALPKKLSQKTIKQQSPFLIGLLTFLLPCGFTLAAEGAAILSGSALRGLLIMLFFVLGTSLPLLAIGLSSAKLSQNRRTRTIFTTTAGLLIIFFVIYTLNFQFGFTNRIQLKSDVSQINKSSEIKPGVQRLNTVYTDAKDISPSSFEVKVNQPVRLEIKVLDNGYGCMSTIMIPGLWEKPKPLIKNQTIVMEFTPKKIGTYKITCAMGVPRGTIIVK